MEENIFTITVIQNKNENKLMFSLSKNNTNIGIKKVYVLKDRNTNQISIEIKVDSKNIETKESVLELSELEFDRMAPIKIIIKFIYFPIYDRTLYLDIHDKISVDIPLIISKIKSLYDE